MKDEWQAVNEVTCAIPPLSPAPTVTFGAHFASDRFTTESHISLTQLQPSATLDWAVVFC